jgi:hypothetical protein
MNLARAYNAKKNLAQSDFPACKKAALLLKTKMETAPAPFRQRRSPEFTSLFERWSFQNAPRRVFFCFVFLGGSHNPMGCGIGILEAQDTGLDKFAERKRLAIVA